MVATAKVLRFPVEQAGRRKAGDQGTSEANRPSDVLHEGDENSIASEQIQPLRNSPEDIAAIQAALDTVSEKMVSRCLDMPLVVASLRFWNSCECAGSNPQLPCSGKHRFAKAMVVRMSPDEFNIVCANIRQRAFRGEIWSTILKEMATQLVSPVAIFAAYECLEREGVFISSGAQPIDDQSNNAEQLQSRMRYDSKSRPRPCRGKDCTGLTTSYLGICRNCYADMRVFWAFRRSEPGTPYKETEVQEWLKSQLSGQAGRISVKPKVEPAPPRPLVDCQICGPKNQTRHTTRLCKSCVPGLGVFWEGRRPAAGVPFTDEQVEEYVQYRLASVESRRQRESALQPKVTEAVRELHECLVCKEDTYHFTKLCQLCYSQFSKWARFNREGTGRYTEADVQKFIAEGLRQPKPKRIPKLPEAQVSEPKVPRPQKPPKPLVIRFPRLKLPKPLVIRFPRLRLPKPTCRVEGCEKTSTRRGLCMACNRKVQRFQEKNGFESITEAVVRKWACNDSAAVIEETDASAPVVLMPRQKPAPKACRVEGCQRISHGYGLCQICYNGVKMFGIRFELGPVTEMVIRLWAVRDHRAVIENLDPQGPLVRPLLQKKTCRVVGCSKLVTCRGLCNRHYGCVLSFRHRHRLGPMSEEVIRKWALRDAAAIVQDHSPKGPVIRVSPPIPIPVQVVPRSKPSPKMCRVEGCSRWSRKRGLCCTCYTAADDFKKKHNLGAMSEEVIRKWGLRDPKAIIEVCDPQTSVSRAPKAAGKKNCRVVGCQTVVCSWGLCSRHHQSVRAFRKRFNLGSGLITEEVIRKWACGNPLTVISETDPQGPLVRQLSSEPNIEEKSPENLSV